MAANLQPQNPPVYLILAARDFPGKYMKGDIVEVCAKGTLKSNWCAPPNFLWVTVTDKSKLQVNVYLNGWPLEFVHTLLNQNNEGWRYKIEVDPVFISVSELNKNEIKQKMADYIEQCSLRWNDWWYKTTIQNWSASSLTLNIPKPVQGNPAYDGLDPQWILMWESNWPEFLQQLENDFTDKFAIIVNIRRYYFRGTSVDSVIAAGGEWSGTHAQVLNHIVDKLSE
jgi:hypothetical protein